MKYRIQFFYPGAGLFMNTNHESDDLDELKRLASSDTFRDFRVRVVDDSQRVLYEPPLRESDGEPSLSGIASALGIPIVGSPEDFLRGTDSAKTKVGCVLEARHKLLEPRHANEPLDWAEVLQRLKDDRARIVTFEISEVQAQKIVCRLWPGKSLLGATCGRGFSIDTAEQIAIVNEVLAPGISISFGPDHKWMLQTWPE